MNGIYSGIGLSDRIVCVEEYMDYTSPMTNWIFLKGNKTTLMLWKKPLIIQGQNIYAFEDGSGYYCGKDRLKKAINTGYRYKFIKYFGVHPTYIAPNSNVGILPIGERSYSFYPFLYSNIVEAAGTNRFGIYNNNNIIGDVLKNTYNYKYVSKYMKDFETGNFVVSTNECSKALLLDEIPQDILDTLQINDILLGRNNDTLNIFSELEKPTVQNTDEFRLVHNECYVMPALIGNIKRPDSIYFEAGQNGIKRFYFRINTILNKDQPNICIYPWICIVECGYGQRFLHSTNQFDVIGTNVCMSLTFVGVEAI